MSKMDIVYNYGNNEELLYQQYVELKKFVKFNNIKCPKRLVDVCGKDVDLLCRQGFKTLQFYIDRGRVNRLVIPTLNVLGKDVRMWATFVSYLKNMNVKLLVANINEQAFVDKILGTVDKGD